MMHAFDVLGDPVRRHILEILIDGKHASGEIVDKVSDEFGISQPAVSQHLKVLRESGFAIVSADGARRIYEIDTTSMKEIDDWMAMFRHFWAPKLAALATEVARGKRRRKRHV